MPFITTPIYYVNDKPHIGSALTTIAADVLARYWRLKGEKTFFLTGTDEHGAKIAEAAEKAGKSPQALADEVSGVFQSTWDQLAIKPDGFIRTTDAAHKQFVQTFLQELYDAGHIYKGEYRGWYCVGCEEYKTETQIGPDNTCLIHLKPLVEIAEEAYLFKLSAFRDQVIEAIESDAFRVAPTARKNEVLSFLKQEVLLDVAISRKNVAWGITLPWDESHTVYVWVDALLNYLSAADAQGPVFSSGNRPSFPPTVQLIGKDILRFHAVIWPALLLAARKPLPEQLFVHGFFTVDGHKMSKSLGNVIAPQDLIDRYGVDASRYLLLNAIVFGADGDISFSRLDELYTSDLANNLGNLVNRVQTMLTKYVDGVVPSVDVANISGVPTVTEYEGALSSLHFDAALSVIRTYADALNAYVEETKPWSLAKDTKHDDLATVLATLAEHVYRIGVLLSPFTPDTSQKISELFGASFGAENYATLDTTNHTTGKRIAPIAPLFPRLEA